MSHRDPEPDDFVGKTIVAADVSACNIWRFTFTDGTALAVEVDAVAPGIYGMVICGDCARNWPENKEAA